MTEVFQDNNELVDSIKNFLKNNNVNFYIFKVDSTNYWTKILGHTNGIKNIHSLYRLNSFVNRTIDGYYGIKTFINGGFGLPYYENRQLDFIKAYRFLKSQPSEFYNPICIRNPSFDNRNVLWLHEHPGSAKMTLYHWFDNPVDLTFIVPDWYDVTVINRFKNFSDSYISMIRETDNRKLEYYLGLNKMKSDNKMLKVSNDMFEISEDHRDIPGFVNDMDYTVEITENTVYVNSNTLFRKNADTEMWEVCEL